jgi:two-component system OmpR family response regulator
LHRRERYNISVPHIIYIEDEPAVRENYAEVLEEQGYSVTAYSELPPVDELTKEPLPDLFLLDVGLGAKPDRGFALSKEIRQLIPRANIVFLTTRTDEKDRERGLALGATAYLGKDEPISLILQCIRAAITNNAC